MTKNIGIFVVFLAACSYDLIDSSKKSPMDAAFDMPTAMHDMPVTTDLIHSVDMRKPLTDLTDDWVGAPVSFNGRMTGRNCNDTLVTDPLAYGKVPGSLENATYFMCGIDFVSSGSIRWSIPVTDHKSVTLRTATWRLSWATDPRCGKASYWNGMTCKPNRARLCMPGLTGTPGCTAWSSALNPSFTGPVDYAVGFISPEIVFELEGAGQVDVPDLAWKFSFLF